LKHYSLEDLLEIMAKLRGKDGCPWDKKQTHETLKTYLLEETYEVIDAIDRKDTQDLVEELGDLLLQIVFHSQIGKERDKFDIIDVISGVCEKMIRRHPHIFGDVKVDGEKEVLVNWESIKRREKCEKSQTESMMDVPEAMPALMRAFKIQEKAARVGFDWDDIDGAMDKLIEELKELKEVYKGNNGDRIRDEMGDVIFAAVNVARFLHIDPELALRDATIKFIKRFEYVEKGAKLSGKQLEDMTLSDMDLLWEQGKSQERK